jgi:hypothetical protein
VRSAAGVAVAASAVLALSVVLLPWYALDAYEPNGWHATDWARAAAAAAIATIVLVRLGLYRTALLAAAVGLGCVAYRVISPPDFGFGFGGLSVPVERRAGCWVALASSALALSASARLSWESWRRSRERRPTPSSAAASP